MAPRIAWVAVGASAAALVLPGLSAGLGARSGACLLLIAVGLVAIGISIRHDPAGPGTRVPGGAGVRRRVGVRVRPGVPAEAAAEIGAGGRVGAAGRRRASAIVIGMAVVALRLALGGTGPAASEVVIPEGGGPWTAVVESVGTPRDGQQVATVRLDPEGLAVAATLPRYPPIQPGSILRIQGSLEALPADDGGYGTYLRRIGVDATIRARALDVTGETDTASSAIERLRRASGDALARALPEPEAGLASGILIGLRDLVDRDLAAAFTTAGVSHIVAISGWNIAIVGALVAALLRGRVGRRARSAVTLVAIVAYTLAAGASASVMRAAVMAGVALLARESGRAGAAATALGWGVTIMILADPRTVADVGFQLSALATAGLIAWGSTLTRRLGSAFGGRVPGWLAESLGVSLAAEAATLPVVLSGFGRLALIAPAVNLVAVPLVPPAMAAGALAMLGGWLSMAGAPAAVATILGLPGWLVLAILVAEVRAAAGLPFASLTVGQPIGTLAGAAVAGIVLGCTSGRTRRLAGRGLARLRHAGPGPRTSPQSGPQPSAAPRPGGRPPDRHRPARRMPSGPSRPTRLVATALVVSLVAVVIAAAGRPDGLAHVTILDVGQGDAILVEGGTGARLLVDGGPDPDRLLVALDARIPPWDRRLDIVVLTHPHEDHVAGLALLVDRYRIGEVFETRMRGSGPGYAAWAAALDRHGLRPSELTTGQSLVLDQVRLAVLWPDPGTVPLEPPEVGSGINNASIVLLGSVGRQRFLLTGDIEQDVDPVLVARGLPRVDLLKVAHHGSRTASTAAFIDAVRPAVAVVSVGARNLYGHPAPATLDRIAASGAEVLRTDLVGTVEAVLDGDSRLDVLQDRAAASRGVLARRDGRLRPVSSAGERTRPTDRRRRASRARSAARIPAPRARGRRGRRVDRGAVCRQRAARGPPARRGSGPPP